MYAEGSGVARSLCDMLSEGGYLASGYTSMDSALKAFREDGCELCVADIDASQNQGIRFLELAVRKDSRSPIILITRQKSISLVVEAMKIGIFDYVLKPFSREVFFMTVSRAIEIQQMKRVHDIYAAAFQHSEEGLYLAAADGSFIRINNLMARIVGYRNAQDFLRHVPSIRTGFYVDNSRYEERIKLLQKHEGLSDFDSLVYCRGSAVLWISENIRPVRNADNEVLFYRGTVRDLARRKQGTRVRGTGAEESPGYGDDYRHTAGILLEIIDDLCMSHRGIEKNFLGFVRTIADAIEGKNPLSGGHSERVASYAVLLAREIGCSEEDQKMLHSAAMLHDIGKICIFDSILEKPGRLTEKEFEIVKRHPVHGAGILKNVSCFEDMVPFVMYHHERIDGKGYPEGLKGEQIPLHARILHVADSFDAMTAYRPYREAPGKEYAFAEFKRLKGTQFDRDIVEAAFRVL